MSNKTQPPDLMAVVLMIRKYGVDRNLTPGQLVDIFQAGVAAYAEAHPEFLRREGSR